MNEWITRLQAAWAGMAPRERLLVAIAGGSLGLVILWFAVLEPLARLATSAGPPIAELEQDLELMKRLRRDYDAIAGRLSVLEQRIRSSTDRRGLRTVLSELADQSAVKIDSMEERQSPSSDRYKETRFEVTLKGVSLGQTINYLHSIEAEARLLSVKSLRIKNARKRGGEDEPDLLDVIFTVSSFDPV